MSCFALKEDEMLSLDDSIKCRNLSYLLKITVTMKGNKHIRITLWGERRMGKIGGL